MPKITIRSARRLRQQQIIASLLANNGRKANPPLGPNLEKSLLDAAEYLSSDSVPSLKIRMREVSFEESLPHAASSSSDATLDSVVSGHRYNRERSLSSVSSSSIQSRKRTRCSLQSLSPSVCLSSLASNSSSEDLESPPVPSSPTFDRSTPPPLKRMISSSSGSWGHFVDVVPPENDNHRRRSNSDPVSPLTDIWSSQGADTQPSSPSFSSPFAYTPYTYKRQQHRETTTSSCFTSRHYYTGTTRQTQQQPQQQQHVPTSPGLAATISTVRSESSLKENATVEKALSVMKIST